MTKAETGVEPSMDEILTSIRKIIAEDQVDEQDVVDAAGHDDDDDLDDEILELTEEDETEVEVEPEASIVDDEIEVATDAAVADVVADDDAADDGVDDPTADAEELEIDETDEIDAPPTAAESFDEPDLPTDPDDAPEAPATGETEPTASTDVPNDDALLGASAATAAAGALHRLSSAMSPGDAIADGGRSIEVFLADLLRPQLKDWLDENLPGLVERIVEREIKKLVRDAQPD